MQLTTSDLHALLPLVEKRDTLLAEIAAVEAEIVAEFNGQGPPGIGASFSAKLPGDGITPWEVPPTTKRPYKKRTKGKRGAVKEAILAALKEAGEAGIAVKHLAPKLGLKPQNIHVWLHTSGKKSGLIKALGRGVYALEKSLGAETETAELKAPKPVVSKPVVKAKAPAKKAPKKRPVKSKR